jgi:hypothetical protein
MKFKKETFEFNNYDEIMIKSLVSHLYSDKNTEDIFFYGITPFHQVTQEKDYSEKMENVFERIFPGFDLSINKSYITSCCNLKNALISDIQKLVGHYYNSFIYVPKEGTSCHEFSLSFQKKKSLRQFFKKSEYKSLIGKYYYIFPEHMYFVEFT